MDFDHFRWFRQLPNPPSTTIHPEWAAEQAQRRTNNKTHLRPSAANLSRSALTRLPPGPNHCRVHELSIAQGILDTVVEQAKEHEATRVVSIRLRIGELTAIVDDALMFAFEVLSEDTCAKGARLDIEHVPWQVRCSDCAHEFTVVDAYPQCPRCDRVGGETIAGRELQIVEMDVE